MISIYAGFFLPLNAVTFRPWEALAVVNSNRFLPGPFYPSREIAMTEEGDLAHGTAYSVKKKTVWKTDAYGFRNYESKADSDIVIVGDSNTVGSGVTQDETLSELLHQKTGCNVYSYAPRDFKSFMAERRFKDIPPKIVIVCQIERNIVDVHPVDQNCGVFQMDKCDNLLLNKFAVAVDRLFYKKEIVQYARSKLHIKNKMTYGLINGMFFLQGVEANKDRDASTSVERIVGYRDTLERKGIAFYYIAIPNKETIYYDYFKNKKQACFLTELKIRLKSNNIKYIDLQAAFNEQRVANLTPYQTDDSHWSATGIARAADLTAKAIKKSSSKF